MSLRIWLPLNGDLRNQGISDLIFSAASSNTTTNANGKIGTCYTNNSHSAGGLISDKPILLGSQYSMCCWFKFTDLESSSSLGGGLVSQHRYSKNTGFGLTIKYVSSTTGYLSVNTGTGSARTYNTYCGTTLLQANTWYHACGTYDGTNIKIYVNGILEKTQAYTMSAPEDYLTIFCWSLSGSSGAAIHGDYKLNGALNDVRIYDHCLSAAEVKEIAQGLVLHYKLDGGLFGNPNLVLGSNTAETSTNKWLGHSATGGNLSTLEYDGNIPCIRVTRNDVEQTSWDYLSYDRLLQSQIKTNTTYTVTFDCKPSVDGAIGFTGFVNGNATNYLTASAINIQNICYANKWNHMVYQCVTKSSFDGITVGGQVVYFTRSASLRATNVSVLFKNIKVEEGSAETPWCPADSELTIDRTIVEDSSGYNHNGILNDTNAQFITTTRRYSACIKNSQATNSATYLMQGECNIPESNALTFSWWMNPTSLGHQTSGIFSTSNGTATDYQTTAANMRDSCFDCCNTSGTCVRINVANYITLNEWHHYALTYNGSQLNFYKDGESKVTANQTGALKAFQYIYPFYSKAGGVNRCTSGSLSDFRIYVTQLLDNDIKSLYNIGMKIDKSQNIHTYSLLQEDKNKLYKTGVLSNAEFNEINNLFNLKYDKKLYIEPDGSCWIRIFHHANCNTKLFTNSDTFTTSVYKDEDRWFNVSLCNKITKWELMVKAKPTATGTESKYRWIQTKNPMTAAFADVSSANVTKITSDGYTSYSWGGLYHIGGNTYLATNNGTNGNWWGAIGCWTAYQGGIPGWTSIITTGYEDVYLRIDNLDQASLNVKNIDVGMWTANQFIER